MSEIYLSILSLILVAIILGLVYHIVHKRATRKQRNVFSRWPVPTVALSEWDEIFKIDQMGPSRDTCVKMFCNIKTLGGTSDREAWILSVLAKRSKAIFEFGTCTGKTTYLLALNSSKDSEIHTITLHPEELKSYAGKEEDRERDNQIAIDESALDRFMYSGTPEEKKIIQLFGDSKMFDESDRLKKFDLIFVDGSHAYSYVKSDTEKALKMLKPGGIILWHDYSGPRQTPGVFKLLNDLKDKLSLKHIKETSFVAYKAPLKS
ncbi:MAG: class I SAM-dependent methyltransferase [bacterium]|nr:class I SAM-dependent methyltransferase [bacterium]